MAHTCMPPLTLENSTLNVSHPAVLPPRAARRTGQPQQWRPGAKSKCSPYFLARDMGMSMGRTRKSHTVRPGRSEQWTMPCRNPNPGLPETEVQCIIAHDTARPQSRKWFTWSWTNTSNYCGDISLATSLTPSFNLYGWEVTMYKHRV